MFISKKWAFFFMLTTTCCIQLNGQEKSNPDILSKMSHDQELQLVLKKSGWTTDFVFWHTCFGLKSLSQNRIEKLKHFTEILDKSIQALDHEITLLQEEIEGIKKSDTTFNRIGKTANTNPGLAAAAAVIFAPFALIEAVANKSATSEKKERLSKVKKAKNTLSKMRQEIADILYKHA